MMGITGAFSSLDINERGQDISKHSSTVSLPNMVLSSEKPPEDEVEPGEQPVDFSKKYCETKNRNCTFNKVENSYNNSFTIYAETDLDQPTDYSLRYAEDDLDSDRCKAVKADNAEFVQDTIKTYCTEDTPYETPFNFSTATSMSDLRIDDKAKEAATKPKEIPSKVKSTFSSGLMSPEKPVNYCDEGTPGYFSRVPSCGSLNSIPTDGAKLSAKKELRKNVKFEEVVNYAQETPLMFSRSSSLASLDSIEQHSIHDDRSSVSDLSRLTSGIISPSELPDSPTQTIPPSPRPRKTLTFSFPKKKQEQTISENSVFEDTVKNFKVETTPLQFSLATSLSSLVDEVAQNDKPNVEEVTDQLNTLELSDSDEDILAACINRGIENNKFRKPFKTEVLPKPDVSCDSLRTYCTEGTPIGLSHAGSNSDLSLSSLDKEKKIEESEEVKSEPEISTEKPDESSRRSSFSSLSDDSHESEEALLEECILAGMPKKDEEVQNDISDVSDEDILDNCIKLGITSNRYTKPAETSIDTVKSYFTEDTPALLSNAGSCSNLSVLSIQGADEAKEASGFSSNFSDDEDDKLLDECVRFGINAITKAGPSKTDYYINRTETSSSASFSDSDSDLDLLDQCIVAGMPKPRPIEPRPSDDLSANEKALLQKCILDGMKKCRPTPRPDSSELTEAEHALLRECILSGMPKNRGVESAELSQSERFLLQQCILSGMPKTRRGKRREHTCCEHCPRSREKRGRRKKGRDLSVVYVSHQVVVKKGEQRWV